MSGNLKHTVARLVTGAGLFVVAALLSLGAFGWFSAALYLALKRDMDPPVAALLTGLGVIATAGLLAVVAWSLMRARSRRSAPGGAAAADTPPSGTADLATSLGRAGAQFIATHSKSATFGAFVAGFAIGTKPSLRRTLGRQILDLFR
jgi:predicted lipid-binding transport protein (Tim44 family)